jgi:hypothetical protein
VAVVRALAAVGEASAEALRGAATIPTQRRRAARAALSGRPAGSIGI